MSLYLRNESVPPVRIRCYPKNRRTAFDVGGRVQDRRARILSILTPEPRYSDFLVLPLVVAA